MNCPICGTELDSEGVYGRLALHQDGHISGEIFRCPKGVEQNGTCDSELWNVAGSFYTDNKGELHEGYPC